MSDQYKPEISKCPPVTVDANGNWVPLNTHQQPQMSNCPPLYPPGHQHGQGHAGHNNQHGQGHGHAGGHK